MSRKRKVDPEFSQPSRSDGQAMSEVAAMIIGCQSRMNLPVLADYLEEKYQLSSTGRLLRLPEFLDCPPECADMILAFDYYPLASDAFLWIAETYFAYRPKELLPGILVGLYAHPPSFLLQWFKLTVLLPNAFGENTHPVYHRQKLPLKILLLEKAREELAAWMGSQGQSVNGEN